MSDAPERELDDRTLVETATTTPGGEAAVPPGQRRTLVDAALNNNLLVAVALLLAIFLLLIGRKLLGVDSWLTLVAGREITQHGLPDRETLTTIPLGRDWIDQQWLAQLLFYGLDRVGGLGLAVAFHALMVSTAFAITMVAARVRGASSRMTLVAIVVCVVVAPWSWQLRAQSIALPLFALTLALVSTDQQLVARRTLLVFPALVVWANVHGSVLLGAALVSLAGAVELVQVCRRHVPTAAAGRPALFLVLPWICLFATPYGITIFTYYRRFLANSAISKYITEWQSPKPHGYFLVFFAVAAATIAIAIWQRRRLSLYDLAVLTLTLAAACRSVRAVVWFSLALAMLLPLALDGFVKSSAPPPVHRRLAAGVIGILAATLAVTAVVTVTRSDAWFEQDWSTRGARATARAAASDAGLTVWASGQYSDWLLWKEPSLRGRIAWDVRFELLTRPELRSIVRFNSAKGGWRAAATGYPVLVIDRNRNEKQAAVLRRAAGNRVLYADSDVIVIARGAGRELEPR